MLWIRIQSDPELDLTFWHSILRNFMQLLYFEMDKCIIDNQCWGCATLWCGSWSLCYFNADLDHAPHRSDKNLRSLVLRSSTAPFCACKPPLRSFTALYGSILSLHSFWIRTPIRIRIRHFTLIRIQIRNIVDIQNFLKAKINLFTSLAAALGCVNLIFVIFLAA